MPVSIVDMSPDAILYAPLWSDEQEDLMFLARSQSVGVRQSAIRIFRILAGKTELPDTIIEALYNWCGAHPGKSRW